MGTTSGTLSDEGPEPLEVFAEVIPLHSTFSEPQKLRHSSASHFHHSLRSLLGVSSISILHGPMFPACTFGHSGTGNGFVTDAFLCSVTWSGARWHQR